MNNTNGTLATLRGKLFTDIHAQTFNRLTSYTQAVVYLENLKTQKVEAINRAQFIKWLNTGALNLIN